MLSLHYVSKLIKCFLILPEYKVLDELPKGVIRTGFQLENNDK